jgi:phenylacetate-CoA ligase
MMDFHLHSLPGSIWPSIPGGEVSQLWAMYLELDRTQWHRPADLIEGQLTQLRTLLTHCIQHVPYYQEMMRQANLKPQDIQTLADVRHLPRLQRRTYQDQCDRFQARGLPAGTTPTTTMRTSGTSGMPIAVRQTNLVNFWWCAFHLRDLAWCGVDLRRCLAVIRGLGASGAEQQRALRGYKQDHWNDQFPRLLENGPAYVMDIHQEPRQQLQWLLRVQPDYLLSYPPNLEFLAGLLVESGQRLDKLRTILTLGETLTDEGRARIESGFGVPVKNSYSCVEAGYLASTCPAGHGLHVHGENVLLEVLNEHDKPCQPGETGRVVLTTLHNFLTPFVRYEILDSATLGPERCPCGRGLPLLTHVQGKRRPQFRLPDGRRKDSGFLVRQLRKLGAYHQHQIIQQRIDHLLVRLIPNRTWTEEHTAQVVHWVQEYFEAPIDVEVQVVDRLEMTEAGKVRDVLVQVDIENQSFS